MILEKSGGGEKTPVGRMVIFNHDPKHPTVNSNFTNLFRVKTEIVNPKYFVYLLSSLYLNGITVRNVKQTTGIQNLDIYGFMTEKILLPSISEQNTLVNYLDKKS